MEWNSKDPREESQDSCEKETSDKFEIDSKKSTKAGRWTDEEHQRFLEALQLFGKNWNLVHKHIGTRSSAQTRSHA